MTNSEAHFRRLITTVPMVTKQFNVS